MRYPPPAHLILRQRAADSAVAGNGWGFSSYMQVSQISDRDHYSQAALHMLGSLRGNPVSRMEFGAVYLHIFLAR